MENHSEVPWHAQSLKEIYSKLLSSEYGLSNTEANTRLQQSGPNTLHSRQPKPLLQMLLSQILDPLIILSVVIATSSFLLQERTGAFVILVIIFLNVVIDIIQEKKAISSLEFLKTLNVSHTCVIRNKEKTVRSSHDLVVGDLVILKGGCIIPADIRLIETSNFKVQESTFTGKSVSIEKKATAIPSENCLIPDRLNMTYTASIVTYGHATGIVVATGMNTELGKIAKMIHHQIDYKNLLKRKWYFTRKRFITVGLIVCTFIFLIGTLQYQQPLYAPFSIANSVISAGLPSIAMILMALGIQRIAKNLAFIKVLSTLKTFASATVICSDKIRTLTQNKMTVTHIATNTDIVSRKYSPIALGTERYPDACQALFFAASLCINTSFNPNSLCEIIGDPSQEALLQLVQNYGLNHSELEQKYPRILEYPFDSIRKRITTVHQMEQGYVAYTKGDVNELLPRCTHILTSIGIRPLTQTEVENIHAICEEMSENALQVLGFTMRTLGILPSNIENTIEENLTFLGIIGIMDSPEKVVNPLIDSCHKTKII